MKLNSLVYSYSGAVYNVNGTNKTNIEASDKKMSSILGNWCFYICWKLYMRKAKLVL